MKTVLASAVIALGLTLTVPQVHVASASVTVAPTEEPGTLAYPSLLPPCDDEDGTVVSNGVPVDSCYWDASVRGNGTGNSFIAVRK